MNWPAWLKHRRDGRRLELELIFRGGGAGAASHALALNKFTPSPCAASFVTMFDVRDYEIDDFFLCEKRRESVVCSL